MQSAQRLKRVPMYVFAELGARIRELQTAGRDIIRLDVGSPDMPPPASIMDALCQSALDPGHHGYAGYLGMPRLRQAIADYYDRRFGVALDASAEVLPLLGSKEGIANIALAWLDPGDLALVPDPGYPSYRMGSFLAGATAYALPLLAQNDYLPDLGAIPKEVANEARILWLNYPNNPTGAIAPIAFLERAVAFAHQHDILICHDAPYCDVCFGQYRAPSLLQVAGARDVAIEFNSLSKSHNMAGWRIGMAVGNSLALAALLQIKSNMDSGIFRAVQDAAAVALESDAAWQAARNAIYEYRRDLILNALGDVGIEARVPTASLYVWAETPSGHSSAAFCNELLNAAGISVTPGTAFGQHGEGYFRISLGQDTEQIVRAISRLREFMSEGKDHDTTREHTH